MKRAVGLGLLGRKLKTVHISSSQKATYLSINIWLIVTESIHFKTNNAL